MADNRKTYILKRGTHSALDKDGNRYEAKPGDPVLLTDEQYKSFSDKFTSKAQYDADIRAQQARFTEAAVDEESTEEALREEVPTNPQPAQSDKANQANSKMVRDTDDPRKTSDVPPIKAPEAKK